MSSSARPVLKCKGQTLLNVVLTNCSESPLFLSVHHMQTPFVHGNIQYYNYYFVMTNTDCKMTVKILCFLFSLSSTYSVLVDEAHTVPWQWLTDSWELVLHTLYPTSCKGGGVASVTCLSFLSPAVVITKLPDCQKSPQQAVLWFPSPRREIFNFSNDRRPGYQRSPVNSSPAHQLYNCGHFNPISSEKKV